MLYPGFVIPRELVRSLLGRIQGTRHLVRYSEVRYIRDSFLIQAKLLLTLYLFRLNFIFQTDLLKQELNLNTKWKAIYINMTNLKQGMV